MITIVRRWWPVAFVGGAGVLAGLAWVGVNVIPAVVGVAFVAIFVVVPGVLLWGLVRGLRAAFREVGSPPSKKGRSGADLAKEARLTRARGAVERADRDRPAPLVARPRPTVPTAPPAPSLVQAVPTPDPGPRVARHPLAAPRSDTPAPPRPKATALVGPWVPQGTHRTVHGRDLPGPLYVGVPPRNDSTGRTMCYVDSSLSVARSGGDIAGDDMPYWPSYAQISPRARATYLDWLAGERRDARYDAGYMFLYFYGLEVRFFADDPPTDERQVIVDEVRRLREIYAQSGSARGYLTAFLVAAAIVMKIETEEEG